MQDKQLDNFPIEKPLLNYPKGISTFYNRTNLPPLEPLLIEGKQANIGKPILQIGTIDDLTLSTEIAEQPGESIPPKFGPDKFIKIPESEKHPTEYIFGNHNHALFAWYEAFYEGKIKLGCTLIHIDTHADNAKPRNIENLSIHNLNDAFQITTKTEIDGFIAPAVKNGLISRVIWICPNLPEDYYEEMPETETTIACIKIGINSLRLKTILKQTPKKQLIADIDWDYFHDEEHPQQMSNQNKLTDPPKIKQIIESTGIVTTATSPSFIDQKEAIEICRITLSL
jgi:hypothetical protein